MHDLSEYELHKSGDELANTPYLVRRVPAIWLPVAILIVAAAIGVYFLLRGREQTPTAAPAQQGAVAPAKAPARPLGGEAEPIEVPPLNESDPVVRSLVRALSTHPRVTAWLATNGLIRNFAVVVENIAGGSTPSTHLGVLRPSSAIYVTERSGTFRIDPRSYARYSSIADAVDSIDPAASARVYATLKPRIEEAYLELGHSDPFDRALEMALVSLLQVPVTDAADRVVPGSGGYAFADPRLEQLTAAQKQLLRMGPQNALVIQRKLRDIALALGIPAERLPPPQS
jgi:hypothetical protein